MTANDVWTCCACQSPNLIANADVKCPVCAHTNCTGCSVGRPGLHRSSYNVIGLSTSLPTPSTPNVTPRYSPFPNNIALACESNTSAQCRPYGQYGYLSLSALDRLLHITNVSRNSSTRALRVSPLSHGRGAMEPLLFAKPSTVGWWECHSCHWANNPSLYPRVCSNCSHTKCTACTTRTY